VTFYFYLHVEWHAGQPVRSLFYGYCTLCYEYVGNLTVILAVTLQSRQDYRLLCNLHC